MADPLDSMTEAGMKLVSQLLGIALEELGTSDLRQLVRRVAELAAEDSWRIDVVGPDNARV